MLDLGSPVALNLVPDTVEEYRERVLKRALPPLIASAFLLLAGWVVSSDSNPLQATNLRYVPGPSVLSGFALLATLVVAVQVQARSLKIAHKRSNPGQVDFLGWMCWVIMLAGSSMMIVALVQSFDVSGSPIQIHVDGLRAAGSGIFGSLIILFASDAVEHAQLLNEQSQEFIREQIRDKQVLLRSYPKSRYSVARPYTQLILLFVVCPALNGILAAFWLGGRAIVPALIASIIIAVLALYQLSKLCELWYLRKWWSLTGNIALGALFWVLFASAFLAAGSELAAAGRWGTTALDAFGGLFRFCGFYLTLTTLPLYLGLWMCRTSAGGRGLILDVAVRRTLWQLLGHRKRYYRRQDQANTAHSRVRGEVVQVIGKRRNQLLSGLLVAIGMVLVAGGTWLVVLGPPTFAAMFPGQ